MNGSRDDLVVLGATGLTRGFGGGFSGVEVLFSLIPEVFQIKLRMEHQVKGQLRVCPLTVGCFDTFFA